MVSKREKIVLSVGGIILCVAASVYFWAEMDSNELSNTPRGQLKTLPNGNLQKTIDIPSPPTAQVNKSFNDIAAEYVNLAPANQKKQAVDYVKQVYSIQSAQLKADTSLLQANAEKNLYDATEWRMRREKLATEGIDSLDSNFKKDDENEQRMPLYRQASFNKASTQSPDDKSQQPQEIEIKKFQLNGLLKSKGGGYKAFLGYEDQTFEVFDGYELLGEIGVKVFANRVVLSKLDEPNARPISLYSSK